MFAWHVKGTTRRPAGAPVSEGWEEKETEDTGARSHKTGLCGKEPLLLFHSVAD